jgi:uncharacterized iron-regulated protein
MWGKGAENMKRALSLAIAVVIALVAGALLYFTRPSQAHVEVLRLKDRKVITFQEMIGETEGADLVLVGELHDSVADHGIELDVIKAMRGADRRFVVGLEMFTARSQPELDLWVSGKMTREQFIPVYYDNWHMPWPLYSKILDYLRQEEIPALGLNIPGSVSRKVAEKGFASLSKKELGALPPGLSCDVGPGYMEYIREVYDAHGMDGASFVHFCEAQLLWDKSMAWHAVRYARDHPGTTVVVLTGITHAMKRGIPEQARRLDESVTCKVILPSVPGVPPDSVTEKQADYLVFY